MKGQLSIQGILKASKIHPPCIVFIGSGKQHIGILASKHARTKYEKSYHLGLTSENHSGNGQSVKGIHYCLGLCVCLACGTAFTK